MAQPGSKISSYPQWTEHRMKGGQRAYISFPGKGQKMRQRCKHFFLGPIIIASHDDLTTSGAW
jgi:hypothetical protein